MESSYPRRRGNYMCNAKREREKFLSRVILPAISGQKCPICLERLSDDGAALLAVCRHAFCLNCIRKWSELKRKCPLCNAEFDSWFYKINLYSRSFLHHHLLPLCRGRNSVAQTWRAPPRSAIVTFPSVSFCFLTFSNQLVSNWCWICCGSRFLERSRAETNIGDRRTRPLPWRRSFGRSGSSAPSDVVAERKLEWRARYVCLNWSQLKYIEIESIVERWMILGFLISAVCITNASQLYLCLLGIFSNRFD